VDEGSATRGAAEQSKSHGEAPDDSGSVRLSAFVLIASASDEP
jgi:hypothetical protein